MRPGASDVRRPAAPSFPALLLAICLLGCALRLAYAGSLPERSHDPDEEMFLAIARNFVAGKGLVYSPWRRASFPPLYPSFLAVFVGSGIFSFRLARTAQCLLGAAACGRGRVVQRFDAKRVTRQQQGLFARIPQGKGVHAAQLGQHGRALGLVQVQQDLGVGV